MKRWGMNLKTRIEKLERKAGQDEPPVITVDWTDAEPEDGALVIDCDEPEGADGLRGPGRRITALPGLYFALWRTLAERARLRPWWKSGQVARGWATETKAPRASTRLLAFNITGDFYSNRQ